MGNMVKIDIVKQYLKDGILKYSEKDFDDCIICEYFGSPPNAFEVEFVDGGNKEKFKITVEKEK